MDSSRAGKYMSNLSGELAYRSYRPSPLPPVPPLDFDESLVELQVIAARHLGQLDAMARYIPNADLFVSMYVRKEALMSSQIEGTQCTLDDILDPEIEKNTNSDVSDVVNYVSAMHHAINDLRGLPLSGRLLRRAHEVLMKGVRGEDKSPGEFRRSQNWIGPAGCSLKDARYVPPNVDDMHDALSDLEIYINQDDRYDPLVRAALIHYQFETIHPFLDGNGRVGRLLILLYLLDKQVLSEPVLYVSYFLKKNQVEYYDRMTEVRRSGNYEQWVRFFLEAIDSAAVDAMKTADALIAMHEENLGKLPKAKNGRPNNVERLFLYLEQYPIIDIGKTAADLGVSYNTVSSAVKRLQDLGILVETTNAQRNRVFAYEQYLAVLREGTEI